MDTVRSLRFTLGWLAMLVLMTAAVFLLSDDVRQRDDHMEAIERSQEEFVSKYAHTNRIGYILRPTRPPEQTEVLFRGLDNPDEDTSFFSDPVAKLFPLPDLLFIISILLSLLAVIFTYDSICGEREDGTLKLLHSMPVSRATVIFGKWLGAWIAIGIPFITVYLFAVLVGSVFGGLSLTAESWIELGLIGGASLVYVSFFLCLGLFVSATVRQSGTSILVLLFLWVVFTMVVPNVSPILASQISPLPSVNAVERQMNELQDTIRDNLMEEQINRLRADLREQYGIPPTITNWSDPQSFAVLGWSEEQAKEFFAGFAAQWRAISDEVNRQQREKATALWDEVQRKIDEQSQLTRTLALASPTPSFIFFSTDVASVGLNSEQYFYDELSEFYRVFGEYIDERQASEEERLGHTIGSNEFLDMSNRPRFSHKPEPLANRLGGALDFGSLGSAIDYAAHLVLMCIIALVLAVVAYLRYDVR